MSRHGQIYAPGLWDRLSPFVQIVFKVTLGIALSGALAFCLWVTKEIYAAHENQARADSKQQMVIDRLDRIENKLDVLLRRP